MPDKKSDSIDSESKNNNGGANQKQARMIGLKKNISYAFVGNLVYTACQWGVLVSLTKLTSVEVVGRFALAMAICTPITVLASMNLGTVQVTDSQNVNSFKQFLGLRLLTVCAAMLTIFVIAFTGPFSTGFAWIIFMVGVNQCIAITRDVFRSYLQKRERMDKVAISQATAGLMTLIAFTIAIYQTRDLLVGVSVMAVARLITFASWDLPAVRKQATSDPSMPSAGAILPSFQFPTLLRLAWIALPVAIVAVLTRTVGIAPRYFIEFHFGAEQLGYFAALAAIPLSSNRALKATTASSLPRLSRQFASRNTKFFKLWSKVMGLNLALGGAGIAVAYFFGEWLLTIMFTADYAQYHAEFVLLMIYGMAAFVAASANSGLNAARRFWLQLPLFSSIAVTVIFAGWWLIPWLGIAGAAWAMIAGRGIQIPCAILIATWLFFRPAIEQGPSKNESSLNQSR